jgi:hypothetical protein
MLPIYAGFMLAGIAGYFDNAGWLCWPCLLSMLAILALEDEYAC